MDNKAGHTVNYIIKFEHNENIAVKQKVLKAGIPI